MTTKTLDEILNSGKSKSKTEKTEELLQTLSKDQIKMILALIANKNQLKLDQEAIKDDTKAIADNLGIKNGQVNKIVSLVMKEQEEGGAIHSEENTISLANQVLAYQSGSTASPPSDE